MEIINEQKQVMISGILGDGSLQKTGNMSFSCIHKEYMELKYKLLNDLCIGDVKVRENNGYKKGIIYWISTKANPYSKRLSGLSIKNFINDLDELGIALWCFDDGAIHKKDYFFNINTHAIDLDTQTNVLVPFLNKHNIFPKIYSETKKDGRKFNYLYIPLWSGVFELSRMMRKLNLDCYSYKLLPKELEDFYFEYKDTEEFKERKTSYAKTCFLKKRLGLSQKDYICEYFKTHTVDKKQPII